ncbi:uncharacterized protein LOC125948259 [Anopheles darlingi]|uniref:uncharacterized protein LOC125948259 n=1 Tax=Anopheles darlingi TaxID=43151 RepID=UPI0021002E6D|nr:uncharacterized protein LOC125948259 [Anopheles darlingi]
MAQVVYLLMLYISIIISQAFSQSLENCKRVASEDALKQLCDSKSYEVVAGTDMDTLLDCVMREFKLIDSSGEGIATGYSLDQCKSIFSDSAKSQFWKAKRYETITGVDMD